VREEDVPQRERDPVAHHLALGAFAAVEQERFAFANDRYRADAAFNRRSRGGRSEEPKSERHRRNIVRHRIRRPVACPMVAHANDLRFQAIDRQRMAPTSKRKSPCSRGAKPGGDSGIGRAAAARLVRECADGASVDLATRQRDADETRRHIEREGRRGLRLSGAVTRPAFCREVRRVVRIPRGIEYRDPGARVLRLERSFQRRKLARSHPALERPQPVGAMKAEGGSTWRNWVG
jgi:hypothetical protein